MKRPLADDPDMDRLEEILRNQSPERNEALMELLEEMIDKAEADDENTKRDREG